MFYHSAVVYFLVGFEFFEGTFLCVIFRYRCKSVVQKNNLGVRVYLVAVSYEKALDVVKVDWCSVSGYPHGALNRLELVLHHIGAARVFPE